MPHRPVASRHVPPLAAARRLIGRLPAAAARPGAGVLLSGWVVAVAMLGGAFMDVFPHGDRSAGPGKAPTTVARWQVPAAPTAGTAATPARVRRAIAEVTGEPGKAPAGTRPRTWPWIGLLFGALAGLCFMIAVRRWGGPARPAGGSKRR